MKSGFWILWVRESNSLACSGVMHPRVAFTAGHSVVTERKWANGISASGLVVSVKGNFEGSIPPFSELD